MVFDMDKEKGGRTEMKFGGKEFLEIAQHEDMIRQMLGKGKIKEMVRKLNDAGKKGGKRRDRGKYGGGEQIIDTGKRAVREREKSEGTVLWKSNSMIARATQPKEWKSLEQDGKKQEKVGICLTTQINKKDGFYFAPPK